MIIENTYGVAPWTITTSKDVSTTRPPSYGFAAVVVVDRMASPEVPQCSAPSSLHTAGLPPHEPESIPLLPSAIAALPSLFALLVSGGFVALFEPQPRRIAAAIELRRMRIRLVLSRG